MAKEDESPPWHKSPAVVGLLAVFSLAGASIGVLKYIDELRKEYELEVETRTEASIAAANVAQQAADGSEALSTIRNLEPRIQQGYQFSECWWTEDGCEGLPKELPADRKQNESIERLRKESELNRQFRREHCQDHRDESSKAGGEPWSDCSKL